MFCGLQVLCCIVWVKGDWRLAVRLYIWQDEVEVVTESMEDRVRRDQWLTCEDPS